MKEENNTESNTGKSTWDSMRTMANNIVYRKEHNKSSDILRDNGYLKNNGYLKTALGILGIILMLSVAGLGAVDNQNNLTGVTSINEADNLGANPSYQETVVASNDVTSRKVTNGNVDARQPSWSGDSQSIAFMTRDGGWRIKTIRIDGSSVKTLAGGAGGIEPAWYGNKIAFSRGTSDPTMNVYVMNHEGTNTQTLAGTPGYDEYPDWHPSGTKLAFVSQFGVSTGPKYIGIMNADGSNKKNLGIVGIQPSWSPDGTKIAYKCYKGRGEICIINADGSGGRQLTHENVNTHEPDWSPDGKYIAYASMKDGDFEIYAINVDGTNRRQLTSNNVLDNHPSWSPNGRYIAYSSKAAGSEDIWIMTVSGATAPTSAGITVVNPNGGETWLKGTTNTITWSSSGSPGANVKIELLKGTAIDKVIIASTPNDGSFEWLIPATQATGIDYKIRITGTTDSTYQDVGDSNFKIS